jgi:N-acetylmuramoyl-L-alanine amidase
MPKYKVFLDPGHGGDDNVNRGPTGYREDHGNLQTCLDIKEILLLQPGNPFDIKLARETDVTVKLSERTDLANLWCADIYISVHSNAGPPAAHGLEVFHSIHSKPGQGGAKLAKLVHDNIVQTSGVETRGIKTKASENTPGKDFYHVIRETDMSAIIVEMLFHTNPEDENRMKIEAASSAYGAFAVGIAKGICEYHGLQITLSVQQKETVASQAAVLTSIMGTALITIKQAEEYIHKINPGAPHYAQIYKEEGDAEGVRWDVAFAQSCKETGYWRFGGDVLPEQNNFAGIGATNSTAKGKGAWFKDPREGIRAQIQHLKAYASLEPLKQQLVDTRFQYVSRGYAPNVEWLGAEDNPKNAERIKTGQAALGWAFPGRGYGKEILDILHKIGQVLVPDNKPQPNSDPTSESALKLILSELGLMFNDAKNDENLFMQIMITILADKIRIRYSQPAQNTEFINGLKQKLQTALEEKIQTSKIEDIMKMLS